MGTPLALGFLWSSRKYRPPLNKKAMSTPTTAQRNAAREAWIKRFAGYFGDPIRLGEYRAGTLTFEELYRNSIGHAEDMVNEAGRYDPAAWDHDNPNA